MLQGARDLGITAFLQEGLGCKILDQERFSAAASCSSFCKGAPCVVPQWGYGMESLEKPPLQHILASNLLRIRSFFSLCDALSPEFGKDRRPDILSVDCLLYLVKHMLTNEEIFFSLPVTLPISVCCVWAKIYIAKACHKNEMAKFMFLGKKIPGSFWKAYRTI